MELEATLLYNQAKRAPGVTGRFWHPRAGNPSLTEVVSMATQYPRYSVAWARSAARLAARISFTLAGAAGLVVGAVLTWSDGVAGTDLSVKAFYQTTFVRADSFISSVGFVFVVLGLTALVSLASPSGGLTRLAGVLGIAGFVLFAVQVYRSSSAHVIDQGAWVALAGAVAAFVGGYFARFFPYITRVVQQRER
jgi:hypothetical protein